MNESDISETATCLCLHALFGCLLVLVALRETTWRAAGVKIFQTLHHARLVGGWVSTQRRSARHVAFSLT